MWTTYWWEITDENSDAYGKEFFTELKNATHKQHFDYVRQMFPNTTVCCHGKVTTTKPEKIGIYFLNQGLTNSNLYDII